MNGNTRHHGMEDFDAHDFLEIGALYVTTNDVEAEEGKILPPPLVLRVLDFSVEEGGDAMVEIIADVEGYSRPLTLSIQEGFLTSSLERI